MYAVLARNTGMWGCESLCKGEDGNTLLFATKEEAQKYARDCNNRTCINSFTQYFPVEYKKFDSRT